MKKTIFIFFFIIFIFSTSSVYAIECPNADIVNLRKSAAELKVSYDEVTGVRDPNEFGPPDGYTEENYVSYYNYFEVKFLNINENIFIKVTNNITEEEKIINFKDTENGVYKFDWKDTSRVTNLKYTVYASDKTNCYSFELKKGSLTLPAYNPYHIHNKCIGYEDYSLCHKYVNFNITYDSFIDKIDKHIEEMKKEDEEKKEQEKNILHQVNTFYKKNKKIILIISGGIILIGGFVIGLNIRKKRSRAI